LHQQTGLVYLACSTPSNRPYAFTDPVITLNKSKTRVEYDYLAIYNPSTNTVTRLHPTNFNFTDTAAVHGMDVVPSADPDKLWIYLVNHRLPKGLDPNDGLDSVIELFETRVGEREVKHIRTFNDSRYIIVPNDVVGLPDGKGFYVTNHLWTRRPSKVRILNTFSPFDCSSFHPANSIDPCISQLATFSSIFISGRSSIVYCHVDLDTGCKFSAKGLPTANGIASNGNGTFYVASTFNGGIRVLEEQAETHEMVVVDTVPTSESSNKFIWEIHIRRFQSTP
jgi:arylesterase / paraoxonase